MISSNLAEGWSLERLDPVLIAILRCAIYELWCRADIPAKATIHEYVGLAYDFYQDKEPKFINGMLDKLARHLRESEMSQAKKKK
jgi:N utilization substance protein B